MAKDRFLTGILIGISVLVLAALVLFFVRQGGTQYADDSTPAGVLHNYLLALQRHEYQRAYDYLADNPKQPNFDSFRAAFMSYQSREVENTAVELDEAVLADNGKTTNISITLITTSQDPFSSPYRNQSMATLVEQNGNWKISSVPYPFWGYNWDYQHDKIDPVPAAP